MEKVDSIQTIVWHHELPALPKVAGWPDGITPLGGSLLAGVRSIEGMQNVRLQENPGTAAPMSWWVIADLPCNRIDDCLGSAWKVIDHLYAQAGA